MAGRDIWWAGLTDHGYVGASVRSSLEVVELERGDCENRVFMDRCAYESDGVILINRIKAQIDHHDKHESRLGNNKQVS